MRQREPLLFWPALLFLGVLAFLLLAYWLGDTPPMPE
jgi:hypothetical protein